MKFIDLFAGLGGFHLALRELNHECVFACELDKGLRTVYRDNFGIDPEGDIREVAIASIPPHDVLCAGFPCQPFSKAGSQEGFQHPKWGDLFDYVLAIIRFHLPSYFMLENVPHLERHDGGRTWSRIEQELIAAGYDVRRKLLSPHRFGIPQIRERLFIVGVRAVGGLESFTWPADRIGQPEPTIRSVLQENPVNARPISPRVKACLAVWQEFLDGFAPSDKLPSFPIWSMEFGATYPYREITPSAMDTTELVGYLGTHGRPLSEWPRNKMFDGLPSYARATQATFPKWKVDYIRQNRELYWQHKSWIDRWIPKILPFPPSWQKLEWNCQNEERDITRYIIQFRASGVRVKRPTTAPSLIAMTDTQVPIIGWEDRYMTVRECAKLQSMEDLTTLPSSLTRAYSALGNAVNVQLVHWVAQRLLAIPVGTNEHDSERVEQFAVVS